MAQRYILIFVFFQTPLHSAAWNGKGDVVEILLRNGANIHETNVRNLRNEKWWMERLRDRVNNYENGDLRGRWFLCVREKERGCDFLK